MELSEKNRRINLIKKYYPNSIILRSPSSWNVSSDIDLLINSNHGEFIKDFSTEHEGVKFDLFIDSVTTKKMELIRFNNINGINILAPELEKIIFIIKDLFHLGKFRSQKYEYYSNIKTTDSIITNQFLRFVVNKINNKNYYFYKTLSKLYAEIHLFIWTRRVWKDSNSIRDKKIISKYNISSI